MRIVKFFRRVNPRSRGFISTVGGTLYVCLALLTSLALPRAAEPAEYGLSLLIITLGALVGGSIGTLLSPSESGEKETFKAILGIASAVLTGVIWKSFETDLHIFFTKDLPQTSLVQVRFFSFAVATFFGAFVMYAYRAYGGRPDAEKFRKHVDDIRAALGLLEKQFPPEKVAPNFPSSVRDVDLSVVDPRSESFPLVSGTKV